MLSPTEKTLLKELLALAPVPEQTFSLHELMGFMFGITITPAPIPEEEWMSTIFGEDDTPISARDQARSMSIVLKQIHETFIAKQQQGDLFFPYQLETLEREGLEEVLEWVSGFEEALALRPEFWEPDVYNDLTAKQQEELFFSMMVIQGLVDPIEVMPFFDKLPDEIFSQAFSTATEGNENRELQIQAFLLATLPLSIQTLQDHAERLGEKIVQPGRSKAGFILEPASFHRDEVRRERSAGPRRDNVIQVDFARKKKLPQQTKGVTIYQFKVGIQRSKPPIWRRILVPGWATLEDLHEIIQVSMGWYGDHLHHFEVNGNLYGPILEDEWGMETLINEQNVSLDDLALSSADKFTYIYDYGDNWQHQVTVEQIVPDHDAADMIPRVIKGKRACPPENIGGIWGYHEFLEAYTDPSHEDHAVMLEWAGPDFKPDLFNNTVIEEINLTLLEMFL